MLKIYNSFTQEKTTFEPINPGKISLYVCGITVYDYCHIGHARVFVGFDTIVRYLRWRGWEVNYVRNITDIDDKIIQRAAENNEPINALTARFIDAMNEDAAALNVEPPSLEPRATEHIKQMQAMIQQLIDKGYAYHADQGDVYFSVEQDEAYGSLAKRALADMQSGARLEVDTNKRNPLDFVLWKQAKPNEPYWTSPWGDGRPGWHIECSAMSTHHLGSTFDLHGGGHDLLFPHHENERAQSECATGKRFANCWLHMGFVQVNKEKMSKSLGNFFTIRDVLKHYKAEVIRYFLIASHYRSPVNYSTEQLDSAQAALTRLYNALRGIEATPCLKKESAYHHRFNATMEDDFNTAGALAVLFELATEINRQDKNDQDAQVLAGILIDLGQALGLLMTDPAFYFQGDSDELAIEAMIEKRQNAKANKNWAEADAIRDSLKAQGILLEDVPGGETRWQKIKK